MKDYLEGKEGKYRELLIKSGKARNASKQEAREGGALGMLPGIGALFRRGKAAQVAAVRKGKAFEEDEAEQTAHADGEDIVAMSEIKTSLSRRQQVRGGRGGVGGGGEST